MSNLVLSADLIEVDSFGYYDESKESVTNCSQERPGWILAEDVFFVARSFGLEHAILTSLDQAYFFSSALMLVMISSAFSLCKTSCFQVRHSFTPI